jgi:bacterioferritin-associated ferredoxin
VIATSQFRNILREKESLPWRRIGRFIAFEALGMVREFRLAMIVCSCNVISDRDVHACVKPCGASVERARDVFRCLGRTPKCGRCVRNIQGLFDRENAAAAKAALPIDGRRFKMVLAAE